MWPCATSLGDYILGSAKHTDIERCFGALALELAPNTLASNMAMDQVHAAELAVLVAADVDLFKKINDRFGHQAGDRVLRHLGEILRDKFPAPCILGRIGGEEFGIFIPEQNRLQVRQRIHGLRDALEPVEYQRRTIEFTLSFGLVESRGNARLETLRRRADDALYRAKRSGRDELIDAADLDTSRSG